jgi:hypothetical protein
MSGDPSSCHAPGVALTCNIDAVGKAYRLRIGVILLALAVLVALAWALPFGSRLGWILTGALALGGGFSIFEGRSGWCVARAMGFRTRL